MSEAHPMYAHISQTWLYWHNHSTNGSRLSLSLSHCVLYACVCVLYACVNLQQPDISIFVKKVRFFLHPSFVYVQHLHHSAATADTNYPHVVCLVCRPNDVVEVTQPPFRLLRKGWGEFPLRIQLFFVDNVRNKQKPIDYIHHLKVRPCALICTLLLAVGTHTAMHGESLVGSYVLWSGCSRC
jgi:hypothetical protein